MIFDFFNYFLIIALSLTWFYSVGLMVFKVCKIQSASEQFSALIILLLGLTINVVFFSVYKTHFATFNIILILLLLFIWLEYRKGKSSPSTSITFKTHFRKLAELQVIGILFLILKIGEIIEVGIYPYSYAARDDIFYSQVSSFISQHGVETVYIDWINKADALGLIPYHYFELWLNGLLTQATGLLSINIYSFVTSTIILVLLYQAILMIIKEVTDQKSGLKHKIIAISLIFLGDVFFGLVPFGTVPTLTGGLSLYVNHKIVLVFIVLLLSWRSWKYGQFAISLLTLLFIPLLNYGFMPVIMFSVPMFFVIHHWLLKTPESIPYRKVLIYYMIYLVLLIAIQKIFKNPFVGVTTLGLKDLIAYYDEFAKVKTLIHYTLNYFLMIVLLLLPYFFIIIPLKKHGLISLKSGFIVLAFILLLTSLGLSSLLYFIMDTSQIFTIALNILAHLLLYAIIPLLLLKVSGNYFYKALLGIYLLSGFYMLANGFIHKDSRMSRYSTGFLKSVQDVSSQIHGQGMRYLTPSYYTSAFLLNANCNFEGFYLSFLKNDIIIHSVTVNEIPNKQELHDFFNYNKKMVLKSSYYLDFVQQKKLENVSHDSAQLVFVKENNIDFIVAIKDARIPPSILRLITEKIEDPVSGESLMLIDRNRLVGN